MFCKNCGEKMIGDCYTSVLHCPNIDAGDAEPDANPIHCADGCANSSQNVEEGE